jgi:hypothetical protein
MSTLIAYGMSWIGALVILAALTGAYQYVDNHWVTDAGIVEGKRLTQDDWDAAKVEAAAKAQAQRDLDEAAAKTEAKKLEDALAKQRRLNRELTQVVNQHIAVAKFPVSCKLTPELLNDWNRAAIGGEAGDAGSIVPKPSGSPSPASRSLDSGTGLKLPTGR